MLASPPDFLRNQKNYRRDGNAHDEFANTWMSEVAQAEIAITASEETVIPRKEKEAQDLRDELCKALCGLTGSWKNT